MVLEIDPSKKNWQFSYEPVESLSLYRLCSEDYPVMYWAPRRQEIDRLTDLAAELHGNKPGLPKVLEVGCGSGLLSYLLAATGRVEAIATDRPSVLAQTIYHHPNLTYDGLEAEAAAAKYGESGLSLAINSWMPPGLNLTPAIRALNAEAIVYVLEKTGETGVPEHRAAYLSFHHKGKLDDLISYRPGQEYERAFSWRGPAHWELVELRKGRQYPDTVTDSNLIEVQLKAPADPERTRALAAKLAGLAPSEEERYAWEKDLMKHKGREAMPILLSPAQK